ncbi:uncharacterized protein LY89DRAFT_740313 [Mollisia scopiformis]|uniref:Uncharacterized protein n=1 Tax=Mollisia scopiformis TaxID=149040 RepID=A0A132BDH8_MOLSC|nr:uncharacterized protein LY89DRAFT_740313 [Mollisia scopiformis]KUJ09894.1 hypothetical protein LY89DRAFT_740313 [Mollisia scopiformis]
MRFDSKKDITFSPPPPPPPPPPLTPQTSGTLADMVAITPFTQPSTFAPNLSPLQIRKRRSTVGQRGQSIPRKNIKMNNDGQNSIVVKDFRLTSGTGFLAQFSETLRLSLDSNMKLARDMIGLDALSCNNRRTAVVARYNYAFD